MKNTGPEFTRFLKPIVEVLNEFGGSGKTSEVIDGVIEKLNIPEEVQQIETKSGGSRVRNQVQWARLYLVHGDVLDSSKRGVWSLTEFGQSINTQTFDFDKLYKQVQKKFSASSKKSIAQKHEDIEDEDVSIEQKDYRTELLDTLKKLPPQGFERLSQRLLRESGFEKVEVTGRSGDGGIDGIGVLQVNPFVSFKVLFQCKRYQGSVTPSQVRDFRGAMQGRADKGIIITTGTFTVEAKNEARRDGVPQIELVDGEELIRLFESLELGLKPRATFDLDLKFFEEFSR